MAEADSLRRPRILVTGATGNVRRHVVSGLLAKSADVRAMTRDPSTAGWPDGIERLTEGEMAHVIGEVIGRTLHVYEVPPDTARQEALGAGASPDLADAAPRYWRSSSRNRSP